MIGIKHGKVSLINCTVIHSMPGYMLSVANRPTNVAEKEYVQVVTHTIDIYVKKNKIGRAHV